jgi:hypothetical protein
VPGLYITIDGLENGLNRGEKDEVKKGILTQIERFLLDQQ